MDEESASTRSDSGEIRLNGPGFDGDDSSEEEVLP